MNLIFGQESHPFSSRPGLTKSDEEQADWIFLHNEKEQCTNNTKSTTPRTPIFKPKPSDFDHLVLQLGRNALHSLATITILTARRHRTASTITRPTDPFTIYFLRHLKSQLAQLIRRIVHALAFRQQLARRACIAGGHIQHRVSGKEVARAQQQRHGLDRHDRKILGRGKVGDAKGVPNYDVGVVDGLGAVADPLGKAE